MERFRRGESLETMKPLIFLALLLCVATGAWAHELDGWDHNHDDILGVDIPIETVIGGESSIDQFLMQEIDPLIASGEKAMTTGYYEGIGFGKPFREFPDEKRAIVHYLKALVLIERERLRREEEK